MRLLRSSAVLTALIAVPLIGCGGDDGPTVKPVDAKVFMDAPPDTTLPCAIPMNVPGGTLGDANNRQSANWIRKNMAGTTTFFAVTIPLDMAQKNTVTLAVIKQGASWPTNVDVNWTADPNSATGQAFSFMDENYNQTSMTSDREYWASTGSIKFTAIAQTADANIDFTTTSANYREIDANGADVAGGCTTTLGALTVFLKQMTTVNKETSEMPENWRRVIEERVDRAMAQQ
jgi:hypothetical protein